MIALHSNWTKPKTISGETFYIEDFEILSTVLSALKWRESNGKIKMVTDSTGFSFYKKRDLLPLWDEVTTELDDIPGYINPQTFWAASKIYAINTISAPLAVLDTDFIVWDRLAFDNLGALTVIHREELSPDIYPDMSFFNMNAEYAFNHDFDWSEKPANTSFFVIKSEILKNTYINQALNFMQNANGVDSIKYMVFAEQRLLPMCAKIHSLKTNEFSTLNRLFADGEKYFTHIWGMKQQIRENKDLRTSFCIKCLRRIKNDFPEFYSVLKNIPEIKKYI